MACSFLLVCMLRAVNACETLSTLIRGNKTTACSSSLSVSSYTLKTESNNCCCGSEFVEQSDELVC